jgi:hypothetical protein
MKKKKTSKDYIQDLANEIFMKLRGLIKENDELIDTAKKRAAIDKKFSDYDKGYLDSLIQTQKAIEDLMP